MSDETLDADALLAAYDAHLRGRPPARLPAGVAAEHDGPVLRVTGRASGGHVEYRDLGGLDGAALDALIARQRDHFAARGERVEWKLHGHDRPADLAEHLTAAGFVKEDEESVLIARTATVAGDARPPHGVLLREVREPSDIQRVEHLHVRVWGEPLPGYADDLLAELASDPEGTVVVVAEAGDEMVCAGRVVFERGTPFATLWGGGTAPGWRGRGVYRALVAYRARLAEARGYRYLQVDASSDSRPILERLGFVAVTTTTPYVWSPGRS